jgi:integrase
MIEDFLKKLNVGARTRNNIRNSLVTLFQYARAHGYLPKHQRTEAEDVPRAKDRGGAIGILKPKELVKLLAKAPNSEATLFLSIGAFAGVRTAEMIRLTWEDFNFERGHIIVGKEKSKTATRRLIPILPNLAQWLAPYLGMTGLLFSGGHVPDRVIAFAKQYVKWPNNVLRHSFASFRLAATHDAAKVALEMGNSPSMLFSNYRELADEKEADEWFKIVPEKKPSRKIVQFRS